MQGSSTQLNLHHIRVTGCCLLSPHLTDRESSRVSKLKKVTFRTTGVDLIASPIVKLSGKMTSPRERSISVVHQHFKNQLHSVQSMTTRLFQLILVHLLVVSAPSVLTNQLCLSYSP